MSFTGWLKSWYPVVQQAAWGAMLWWLLQYLIDHWKRSQRLNNTSRVMTMRGEGEGGDSIPGVEENEVAGDPADPDHTTADAIMNRALQYQQQFGDKRLGVDHMLLALADNPQLSEILSCAEGLTEDQLRQAIKKSRVMYGRENADVDVDKGQLAKYAKDLTELAKQGKLDPVIGRNDEIRRCINILSRRTKNNPVLLGDSGVGKTAVVEGLVQRIVSGDVDPGMRDVHVMALDLGSMMAGAFFPGEFEERMKAVLKELVEEEGKYILFIDDIHTVTGPNAQQGGGVNDASVLLKPLLGRGSLRCIGCTTLDKFKKFIEKDPALERRFQQVTIEQPTVSQAVSILRGLRPKYELHHGVRISDAALVAAATMSDRYIPERFLPDKAIDLIDEAAAKVKLEITLKPEVLDRLDRRIKEMELERKILARNARRDRNDALQLGKLEKELKDMKVQQEDLAERVAAEEEEREKLRRLQEQGDSLSAEIAERETGGNMLPKSSLEAKRQQLDELRRKAKELKKKLYQQTTSALTSFLVTEAEVARIISSWTGIPLTKLVQSERDRLLQLSDSLHQRIIGQHDAVDAVANAIQRSRAGLKDPNGPIASFLFLGPTGVGKTELAKALAANLFNSEQAMVRLDMSEFMEKHAVSKLIGAPPGYVGFDEGGQLTEAVRRRPYTVVLFDEVEKAHVDVFNLLLQILDDGRVTDSQGRTVSLKNTIIIMTSNLGSAEIYKQAVAAAAAASQQSKKKLAFDPLKKSKAVEGEDGEGAQQLANGEVTAGSTGINEEMKNKVMEHVRKHFPPEFINRVDEFIVFEALRMEQIQQIVKLRMTSVIERMADKRLKLELQPSALELLAQKGFDPVYGARPVKRAIQKELETPMARALLKGDFKEDSVVIVEGDGDHLTFTPGGPANFITFDTNTSAGGAEDGGTSTSVSPEEDEEDEFDLLFSLPRPGASTDTKATSSGGDSAAGASGSEKKSGGYVSAANKGGGSYSRGQSNVVDVGKMDGGMPPSAGGGGVGSGVVGGLNLGNSSGKNFDPMGIRNRKR